MDKSPPVDTTAVSEEAADKAPPTAQDTQTKVQDTQTSTSVIATNTNNDTTPSLSKNQLKKRRRYEKSQAIKKRRKEQQRQLKQLKAQKEGRDLDAEREQQLVNQRDGKGWKKRENRWKEIMTNANIDTSFRICFDCKFEDLMSSKEINSLSLQLRYVYAVNRKARMPVYIDICGLKKDSLTYKGLEKVEGFPNSWVGRAFHCFEDGFEDVYNGDSSREKKEEEGTTDMAAATVADADKKKEDKSEEGVETTEKPITETNDAKTNESGEVNPSPKGLRPGHQFVYLTGDSPNTLTTLDNNTTYIIGGIVDRNRLKRVAVDRAEAINKEYPSLNIKTARLPLDENLEFGKSTRILTCNHVFEILLKYRENGYKDWGASIVSVLPDRKAVEQKKDTNGENTEEKDTK